MIVTPPTSTQLIALAILNLRPQNIYAGTVPEHVVARRRARNKAARRSRQINRRAA